MYELSRSIVDTFRWFKRVHLQYLGFQSLTRSPQPRSIGPKEPGRITGLSSPVTIGALSRYNRLHVEVKTLQRIMVALAVIMNGRGQGGRLKNSREHLPDYCMHSTLNLSRVSQSVYDLDIWTHLVPDHLHYSLLHTISLRRELYQMYTQ